MNPRPTGPKPVALPNCATPRYYISPYYWQGQKDSNPRHAVLETAALPAELYPYMAEKMGFEPMRPLTNPNGLANRPLQPLEYFSRLRRCLSNLWRRGWDSNPRPLAESLVFKTSTINRSDTSPHAICRPDHPAKIFGDPSEIRTPDTLIKSQVLCQLS